MSDVKQFRRKTGLVKAVQWFRGVAIEGVKETAPERGSIEPRAIVRTGVGQVFAKEGDWIVTGEDGRTSVVEFGSFPGLYDSNLTDELAELRAERDKLLAFKQYVHSRLDAAGVSADPDSPHKAEGCRIGGRLDELIGDRNRLREALKPFADAAILPGAPDEGWLIGWLDESPTMPLVHDCKRAAEVLEVNGPPVVLAPEQSAEFRKLLAE